LKGKNIEKTFSQESTRIGEPPELQTLFELTSFVCGQKVRILVEIHKTS
jgi:hypothetical protein